MNTDTPQERETPLAEIGYRLSEARKALNLSQRSVAEQLRLKVSTIRELEDGLNPLDLAPTFIKGYIRSYAKLVQVPEDELIALLPKNSVEKNIIETNRIKGFTLGKPRKKIDRWLTLFTWLILFVVLGLTGAWWWENHKAQQNDLIPSSGEHEQNQILLPANQPETTSSNTSTTQSPANNSPSTSVSPDSANSTPVANNAGQTPVQNTAPTLEEAVAAQVAEAESANGATAQSAQDVNDIHMTFVQDCWVEVIDARGQNLYSGLQRKDGKLSLSGQAPYRVKVGVPAAVEISYKGKPVDMSQYKNSNRPARLTLAAE
ncbi:cytoskeleton protein RodZ [Jinshanibacter sp. LJY008]|uniref:Cytoskeleton protein RodZ n=1 Tax=Limnobaculum eriocheiris TaxID=2897391 RepID=A0A9X1SN79_9GAMM|nr:cytoskeleton protein RodZ [Limnobaculum eriocheiris]MCD1124672.1 cytoskeleton protein RodZ [Limnobaculum eriocheiris]